MTPLNRRAGYGPEDIDTKSEEETFDKETRDIHILLVEDDEIDAEAIRRAFRAQRILNPITVAPDGMEALDVLRGQNGQEKLPRPYIVLLDINMPRMNGIEFLQTLREDRTLRSSIVFVLTTSDRDEDIMAAYDQQIAGYLLKSRAGKDFIDLVSMLDSYWRVVEFPVESRR